MGSIIKMFKPSKKSSNKENVPSVTFATNSLKSKKSVLNESVYAGEPQKIDLRLKSPYQVMTAPKTKKGPMSCPGAPMEDNFLQDRQNLMRFSSRDKRKVKDDSVLTRRSELVDEQTYRNLMARQQYDMSMSQHYDSDDEDEKYKTKYRMAKAELSNLKQKIEKMKAKHREEKSMMGEHIDDLTNENYQLRKSHDRLRSKYNELKQNNEVEKRTKCDVLKMLQEANARIERFEKSGAHDESLNNSSLLMPFVIGPNGDVTMERSSEGAGEALCFPDGPASQMGQMTMFHAGGGGISSTTTLTSSIFGGATASMANPMSLEDDLNAQDEVRVFRNSEEDVEDEDEEMTEEEAEEMELSSPFEVETVRSEGISRRHSDSDIRGLDTVSLAPAQPEIPTIPEGIENFQRQKHSRTSSWLKRNAINPEEDGSSDSSEEERLSLIERQLKKKGGLVKYNPPRTKIHDRHYKRYGKNERSALAEFEYLQDMSTDVSGLQSSPELGQLMGQLQLKK